MPVSNSDNIRRIAMDYCSNEIRRGQDYFIVHNPVSSEHVYQNAAVTKPGCYIIYDKDSLVLYIGMSEVRLDTRIKNHLSLNVQKCEFWNERKPPYLIGLIEVQNSWEAPSLEAYLTVKTTRRAGVL